MLLFQDMVCGVFNTEYTFVNIELNTNKKKLLLVPEQGSSNVSNFSIRVIDPPVVNILHSTSEWGFKAILMSKTSSPAKLRKMWH